MMAGDSHTASSGHFQQANRFLFPTNDERFSSGAFRTGLYAIKSEFMEDFFPATNALDVEVQIPEPLHLCSSQQSLYHLVQIDANPPMFESISIFFFLLLGRFSKLKVS